MSTCLYSRSLNTGVSSTTADTCRQTGPCIACQKVIEADIQISDIRSQLQEALNHRETLVTFANDHHDLLLSRLPVEVVSNIFAECRPIIPAVHNSAKRYNSQSYTREVIKLSHVCKSWRRLAHGSPQLWTILAAVVNARNCEDMVPLISQWLERSRALPLFVQIALNLHPLSLENALLHSNVQQLLTSIIDHAERWQGFDISMPSSLSAWMSTTLSSKCLNKLDLIKTEVYVVGFAHSPSLRLEASPTIWSNRDATLSSISICLGRLTHFITDSIILTQDMLKLLQGAPQLSYLRLHGVYGDSLEVLTAGEPVLAPNIRVMFVEGFSNHYFSGFTLPALHTLCISNSYDGDRFDDDYDESLLWWTPIVRLIQRSGCKLEALKIHDAHHDGQLTRTFLTFTPHLQRLIFKGAMLDANFLVGLCDVMAHRCTTDPGSAPHPHAFLGQLKLLRCSTPKVDLDWAPLVSFLEGITSSSESSLRNFRFQYTKDLRSGAKSVELSGIIFGRLLDIARKVKVHILDKNGQNLVKQLQSLHA